jgi:hypothetical protein
VSVTNTRSLCKQSPAQSEQSAYSLNSPFLTNFCQAAYRLKCCDVGGFVASERRKPIREDELTEIGSMSKWPSLRHANDNRPHLWRAIGRMFGYLVLRPGR